jgi:2-dehydro-3-deoxyphosphooctonate aldolase (KDO 8-P synthase)
MINKIFIQSPNGNNSFEVSNESPLFFIAGPCVIENKEMAFRIAKTLKEISQRLGINYVFKSSFHKANRSSIESFTGIGFEESMEIFDKIRKELNVPVTTDIHEAHQAELVAPHVDILQIPAFLCRQTDLLVAAAKTGKIISIKKGQFLAAEAMEFPVKKCIDSKNSNIMLIERGTTIGGKDLMVDMRSFEELKATNSPVIFDGTHSAQKPGSGSTTGGNRSIIDLLCRASVSQRIAGLFMEIHENPEKALCDKECQFPLNRVEDFLSGIIALDKHVKNAKPFVL